MRRDIIRPLQRVLPEERDYRPKHGGGKTEIHGDWEVSRSTLLAGVDLAIQEFRSSFESNPTLPAVARVVLKEAAIAKSHRPTQLFDERTCPLIGSQSLGEIYVSASPAGLRRLKERAHDAISNKLRANLSTIERFEPVLPIFDTGDLPILETPEPVVRKVKLFNHRNTARNERVRAVFQAVAQESGLALLELDYAPGLFVYEVQGQIEDLDALRGFVGMQSLEGFPTYAPVRTMATPVSWEGGLSLMAPDPDVDYPVVAVIDDGIDPSNRHLNPWVVGRERFRPPELVENDHGTFVAGMLVFGRALNHDDPRFPLAPCKLVDAPIFEKGRPLSEQDLIRRLRLTIARNPDVKVFNLSLSTGTPCQSGAFSDLAIVMDSIQDEFDVQFVVAAGNYMDRFTRLPRSSPGQDCGGRDRITSPSDSVNAIVVGSIAHVHRSGSAAKSEEPSPFARRGPGAMYIPKPDVAHYGGNMDTNGRYAQVGVISLDRYGGTCESVGTSFSTPIVSGIFAHLMQETGDRQLATALLLHSASLKRTGKASDSYRDFLGFGVPTGPDEAIECKEHEGTLVFDLKVPLGKDLSKIAFPIPECLVHDGKLKANWVVTLVAEPLLDGQRGAEYIGTDASISVGHVDENGCITSQVPPERRGGNAREAALIKDGGKWSPRKGYRRSMPIGTSADGWGMFLSVTTRAGVNLTQPSRVVALVTILDPTCTLPVYLEILKAVNKSGWIVEPMLQNRLRP